MLEPRRMKHLSRPIGGGGRPRIACESASSQEHRNDQHPDGNTELRRSVASLLHLQGRRIRQA